jgi:diadenosine tetraphosphate (Ap4A) HIT family hydrolase
MTNRFGQEQPFSSQMASSKLLDDMALTEGGDSSVEENRGNDELLWRRMRRNKANARKKTKVYHTPPPPFESDHNYYRDYRTSFGAILRGELPARAVAETSTLLAFEDRRPQADLHALIIPKREIGSVFDLLPSDLPMLYEMKAMAEELLADSSGRLVFHVPPFNSVQHLHLHVLAPVDSISTAGRLKFGSETRQCTSWESVVTRLEQDVPAVPYERPGKY